MRSIYKAIAAIGGLAILAAGLMMEPALAAPLQHYFFTALAELGFPVRLRAVGLPGDAQASIEAPRRSTSLRSNR